MKKWLLKDKYPISFVLLLYMLLIIIQSAHAQSTGKIAGNVIESETNEPLPGVNIIIENTRMGAPTDLEGDYFILNISPGKYSLRASMIGYNDVVVTDVVVNINLTTQINFTLSTSIIEGQEIVVVADREIVQSDVANTKTILSGDELVAIPAAQFDDILDKQAGITMADSRGLFIRGSREASISLKIDGIETRDNIDNQVYTGINPDEVEQVELMTGGFDAEYGNATAGIINVVTKEGGDTYSGTIDGRFSLSHRKHFGPSLKYYYDQYFDNPANPDFNWNDAAANIEEGSPYEGFKDRPELLRELYKWRMRDEFTQYGDKPDINLTATFGGPVPFIKNTTFFSSARKEKTHYLYNGATDYFSDSGLMAKITSQITNNMKLSFIYRYTESDGVNRYDRRYVLENSGIIDQSDPIAFHERRYMYNSVEQVAWSGMGGWPYVNKMSLSNRIRNLYGFTFTHVLGQRTFYEIKLLYSDFRINGAPTQLRDTTATITFIDPSDPDYQVTLGGEYALAPDGHWPFIAHDVWGSEIGGTYGNTENSRDKNFTLRGSITSQVNKYNQLNGGMLFKYTDLQKDEQRRSSDGKPYDWFWHVYPKHLALWVSDKLEFEGMTANIGLRADIRIPHSNWYDIINNPYDYHWSDWFPEADSAAAGPHYNPPVKWVLAPRLSISHPIGATAKIFFNYVHLYQDPPLERQYYYMRRYDAYGYWSYGNPELPFQKTVQYEIGYEQIFMKMFRIAISGFYKDNTSLVNDEIQHIGMLGMVGDRTYLVNYKFYNGNYYQSARGVQLSLEKRVGRFWTAWFNFDYEIYSRGKMGYNVFFEDPTQTPRAYDYSDENTSLIPMPRFNFGIDLHTPDQFGFKLGSFFPLSNLNLNILFYWRSQPTFDYNPGGLNSPYDPRDNKRWIAHHMTNLTFSKRFNLGLRITPIFYVRVYNLFNTKNMFRGAFSEGQLAQYLELLEEHGGEPGEREDLALEAIGNRPDMGPSETPYDLYLNPREIWLGFRFELK